MEWMNEMTNMWDYCESANSGWGCCDCNVLPRKMVMR